MQSLNSSVNGGKPHRCEITTVTRAVTQSQSNCNTVTNWVSLADGSIHFSRRLQILTFDILLGEDDEKIDIRFYPTQFCIRREIDFKKLFGHLATVTGGKNKSSSDGTTENNGDNKEATLVDEETQDPPQANC